MELLKFELEVLESYSQEQLVEAKRDLEFLLLTSRELKDIQLDLGNNIKAVEEEKIILRVCDNLDMIDFALEGKVKTITTYGELFLN